jgi:hypothetical protein
MQCTYEPGPVSREWEVYSVQIIGCLVLIDLANYSYRKSGSEAYGAKVDTLSAVSHSIVCQ